MPSLNYQRRTFLKRAAVAAAGGAIIGSGIGSSSLLVDDPFRIEVFRGLEGSVFRATSSSGLVSFLELGAVIEHSIDKPGDCFSLLLIGSESSLMKQDVYTVEVDALTELPLLLVPIWSDSPKPRYEAVVNRFVGTA